MSRPTADDALEVADAQVGLAYGTVEVTDHDPAWLGVAADHTGRVR